MKKNIVTILFVLGLAVFIVACTPEAVAVKDAEAIKQAVQNPSRSENANDLFIVDCLLPGEVRKMGTSMIFQTPRRAIKTTAMDCEIRGGEYTAYNRSNYETALQIWLPQAKQGDVNAQVYVGEIFEKGLGTQPDYLTASQWYEKAAQAGNERAQINLGNLYEKGLGVSKDINKATYWYRKASGLTGPQDPIVDKLKEEAEQSKKRLLDTQKQLERAQEELERLKRSPDANKDESNQERQGPKIELIEPKLTRGLQIRIDVDKDIDFIVIGKIDAPMGLSSFQVNNKETKVDLNGAFRASIKVSEPTTTKVSLVVIDKKGGKDVVDFFLDTRSGSKKIEKSDLPLKGFGNYYALIIGNNDYMYWPPLKTPKNDSLAIAQLLETKYNFKTQVILDAKRADILYKLNDYRKNLTASDNLLIYYAGHGYLETKIDRGYWIPVDAEVDNNVNWIPTPAISDMLGTMSAKHILIVSDSCYSGALTKSSIINLKAGKTDQSWEQLLRAIVEKQSRTALTSGDLQPVLDSGAGNHSVFANIFLTALSNNDDIIVCQTLYENIADKVTLAAANYHVEQTPQYAPIKFAGHEAGDFVFIPK